MWNGRLPEVKNNKKIPNHWPQKWSRSLIKRWTLTRGSDYSDLTGKFWYFGKVVACAGEVVVYEKWSHGEVLLLLLKLYLNRSNNHWAIVIFRILCSFSGEKWSVLSFFFFLLESKRKFNFEKVCKGPNIINSHEDLMHLESSQCNWRSVDLVN